MKFGKNLQNAIEDMQPEFQDKFLCYKRLKKFLKNLPAAEETSNNRNANGGEGTNAAVAGTSGAAATAGAEGEQRTGLTPLTPQETEFVRMLNEELSKFNEFYMEKEEEYVMHLQNLENELEGLRGNPRLDVVRSLEISCVKFHGTLVLLQNWSALNYSALVKILKKHDKHSKLLLRSPFLVNVLRQPFYSTEVLGELVTRTEQLFSAISKKMEELDGGAFKERGDRPQPGLLTLDVPPSSLEVEITELDPSIVRQTHTALELWSKVKSMSIPVPSSGQCQEQLDMANKRPAQGDPCIEEPPAKLARASPIASA